MHAWENGQMAGGRQMSPPAGVDPMPSVSTLQLAATSGSHPPSGHSPMHAYNPLHFALFVILS